MAINSNDETTTTITQMASRPASTASTPTRHRDDKITGWRFHVSSNPGHRGMGFFGQPSATTTLPTSTWHHPSTHSHRHSLANRLNLSPRSDRCTRGPNQLNQVPGDWGPPSNVEQRAPSTPATQLSSGERREHNSKGDGWDGTRVPRVRASSKGAYYAAAGADRNHLWGAADTLINLAQPKKKINTTIVRQGCDDWADNPISR